MLFATIVTLILAHPPSKLKPATNAGDTLKMFEQLNRVNAHYVQQPLNLRVRVSSQGYVTGDSAASKPYEIMLVSRDSNLYYRLKESEQVFDGQKLLMINHDLRTVQTLSASTSLAQGLLAKLRRPNALLNSPKELRLHYTVQQETIDNGRGRLVLTSKRELIPGLAHVTTAIDYEESSHRPLRQIITVRSMIPSTRADSAILSTFPDRWSDKEGRQFVLLYMQTTLETLELSHQMTVMPIKPDDVVETSAEGLPKLKPAFAGYALHSL